MTDLIEHYPKTEDTGLETSVLLLNFPAYKSRTRPILSLKCTADVAAEFWKSEELGIVVKDAPEPATFTGTSFQDGVGALNYSREYLST